ncbi:hypothetical protein [Paenibacillus tyrfis]|uniref:hypothetical protein n=1 Tax=Paenibacillus tyrfis TaxID=1501230 RepID=UPI0020A086E7|nr:hypothetical protein [Paenibacillus tyrfis]MCP1312069.1 hypothetical protein [Paenibacillus tyrfis]
MPKNSIAGEWYAEKEIVKGVLTGEAGKSGSWEIDFNELSRITNGHPEFLSKVKEFAEKDLSWVYNAQVHRTKYPADKFRKEASEHISVVFDVGDTYIKIISCNINYKDSNEPYVLDTSYNKSYVWSMATML